MNCAKCEKDFEGGTPFSSVDYQKQGEELYFCSAECLKSWTIGKIVWLVITLVLGIVIAFSGFFAALFIPYMIRDRWNSLADLFSSGAFGEVVSFAIIILGAVTFVYPIYRIIREVITYAQNLKE